MSREHSGPLVDLSQLPRPRRVSRPIAVPKPEPRYVLTKREAAAFLRISERLVERLLADGSLPSFTIGDRRLIRRIDLETFVDNRVKGISNDHQPSGA